MSTTTTSRHRECTRLSRAAIVMIGAIVLQGCWEAPPMETEQIGYRGVGMQTTSNPDLTKDLVDANVLPKPQPAVPDTGPKAGDVYQNVEVLGHLSVGQFTRTMQAMTKWVSPEQGCAYCHVGNNFASNELYTKRVSRRMMQMTQKINSKWKPHVGNTGVTCLTCHRGKNVPEYVWFKEDGPETASGFSSKSYSQNHVAEDVGYTSMHSDPFSKYLTKDQAQIRAISQYPLPLKGVKTNEPTQTTENTYSLMIHMSESLGQNCTYCHNTRSFTSWEMSPPARVTAWHALQMVPALNNAYLEPLGPTYPPKRLGALGDAPKVNCTTCHQGVAKPFYGESMLDDYPVWRAPGAPGAVPGGTGANAAATTPIDSIPSLPSSDDEPRVSAEEVGLMLPADQEASSNDPASVVR